ncbi:hypothetical protein PULV_a3071 [Pseudoalteromonas ulvae UL12]|nr:hypothetical protein [Pseudoalteromonas ulvae UL12]
MFNALFNSRREQNNTVDEYSVYDFTHITKRPYCEHFYIVFKIAS